MQRVLLFFLPILLGGAELYVDHVTVAGKDLKQMQARLAAVGIACEYGGPHSNHVSEMALTAFPDGSYLELIALQANADPAATARHAWATQMQGDAGPCAWAVREKDLAAEVKRLEAAGITVRPPERGGRTRPDGKRLEWQTAQAGEEPNGTFLPFLISDITPRQDRAYPTGKPTLKDFKGVGHVVIAVRDLEAAIKRYRQAYALPAPIKQVDADFGAHLALMGGTPVVLAAPLTQDTWIARRIGNFGEGPCAYILKVQRSGKYGVASKSRWFGIDVSWFDAGQLGWRLGFE